MRRMAVVGALFAFTPLIVVRPAHARSDAATEIEKIVGREIEATLRSDEGVEEDPLLLPWVRQIGARVSAPSPRHNLAYTFSILNGDVANAFAVPGGYIFVTRGMLDVIDSDDELASILAHESGHVAERHAQKQIGENVLFLAAMAALHGGKYDKLRTGATVLNVLGTLALSRQMEAQADRDGIQFAAAAGYDPRGLIDFFEGLDLRTPSQLERYFSTHPTPASRIAAGTNNPLVTKPTPEFREAAARGFEARGLMRTAGRVRMGRDGLALPAVPSGLRSAPQQEILDLAEQVRSKLRPASHSERTGSVLQQVILLNSRPGDPGWLFLAARAYAVQARVDDMFARTLRVSLVAPATFDALTRSAEIAPAGAPVQAEALLGGGEVRRALTRDLGAPGPIRNASLAVTTVLADLNDRFFRPRGNAAYLRYGADEALLLYAERELEQADRISGEAWRLLALARIRRYQARLNELLPGDDAARRAVWFDLAQRRFGAAFPTAGPAGDATVRGALAIELGVSATTLDTGGRNETWADRVLEKHGAPENVATAIRLLTLDLERETAADDRNPTVSTN